MRKDRKIINEYLVMATFLVLSIVLIFTKETSFTRNFRTVSINIFNYLNFEIFDYYSYKDLESENIYLKKQIVALSFQKNEYKNAYYENFKLRKFLLMNKKENYEYIYSKVVGKNFDNSGDIVLIDIGKNHEIKIDDPVVTADGLVGRVIDVATNISKVRIITNSKNRIPVRTSIGSLPGIIVPINNKEAALTEINKMENVLVGEEVYTSSFSTIYPADIKIGKIVYVKDDPATINKNIIIEYSQNYNSISEVFVMKKRD